MFPTWCRPAQQVLDCIHLGPMLRYCILLLVVFKLPDTNSVRIPISTEASVQLWDSSKYPIIDLAACKASKGRANLPRLGKISDPKRRLTEEGNKIYMEMVMNNTIDGWMRPRHARFVEYLTKMQWSLGVYGAVGEIGVHHGKIFIPIAGNADPREPAVAIDLFEDMQAENVGGSGSGNKKAFCGNLLKVGMSCDDVQIRATNTFTMTLQDIASMNVPRFRLFSVDGAHAVENALHDMMLASCILEHGGIMIVDDYLNPEWLGVVEAVILFLNHQRKIVPFMSTGTKLYMTTASHHDVYLDYLKSAEELGCMSHHASRSTIAGWQTCMLRDPE